MKRKNVINSDGVIPEFINCGEATKFMNIWNPEAKAKESLVEISGSQIAINLVASPQFIASGMTIWGCTKSFIIGIFILCNTVNISIAAEPEAKSCYQLSSYEEIHDPLEKWNRGMFAFNNVIDKAFIRPSAKAYDVVVPSWGKQRVASVLDNLSTPLVMINQILQGKVSEAGSSFGRFLVNSTFGIGGLFDFASAANIKSHSQNFGLTAGFYCIKSGPFLMIPFFGPSTVRDAVGKVVDTFIDPFTYILRKEHSVARNALKLVHTRSEYMEFIDDIEENSIDDYATIKSYYIQNSEHMLQKSKPRTIEYNQ